MFHLSEILQMLIPQRVIEEKKVLANDVKYFPLQVKTK